MIEKLKRFQLYELYTIKLYRSGQALIAYSEEVYFWVLSEVRLSGFAG